MANVLSSPSQAGVWWYSPVGEIGTWREVVVVETAASGRYCRELKMGGHAQLGYAHWSGYWAKANGDDRPL